MYYYPNNNYNYVRNYRYQNNRFFPGAFALPFALGFLTGPLVLRPRPYYYGPPVPYYPNYY